MMVGAAGLLHSCAAMLLSPNAARIRRWAACTVAVSSLLVVALFPATLANILDIANADHPPASP